MFFFNLQKIFDYAGSSLLGSGFLYLGEQGLLSSCAAQVLGAQASVVVAHGLSCSQVDRIFLDQGLNPCPLHWQAES